MCICAVSPDVDSSGVASVSKFSVSSDDSGGDISVQAIAQVALHQFSDLHMSMQEDEYMLYWLRLLAFVIGICAPLGPGCTHGCYKRISSLMYPIGTLVICAQLLHIANGNYMEGYAVCTLCEANYRCSDAYVSLITLYKMWEGYCNYNNSKDIV